MGLIEHTLKCLNPACRLRWLVFGGKPDKVCPYCGSRLVSDA
jgi:rRNA maturation endonuclease Nob1